jgi:hypothetical protein
MHHYVTKFGLVMRSLSNTLQENANLLGVIWQPQSGINGQKVKKIGTLIGCHDRLQKWSLVIFSDGLDSPK